MATAHPTSLATSSSQTWAAVRARSQVETWETSNRTDHSTPDQQRLIESSCRTSIGVKDTPCRVKKRPSSSPVLASWMFLVTSASNLATRRSEPVTSITWRCFKSWETLFDINSMRKRSKRTLYLSKSEDSGQHVIQHAFNRWRAVIKADKLQVFAS